MKKNIFMMVAVLFIGVFALAACSPKGIKTNPTVTENVIGNGGTVVQKGDYIYYVNGIYGMDNYKAGDNDWGKITYGGIYRTKLDNGNLSHDTDGFLTSTERVVSKIVGHPNASFYIFGDYIYYSTPNNAKNSRGQALPNITDFYRVNIDGTNNTHLYTSKTENLTAKNWSVYANESKTYLLVKDGENLVSVHNGKTTTIATGVTQAVFVEYKNFYNNHQPVLNNMNNVVYYTREIKESDKLTGATGNIIARTSISEAKEEILLQQNTKVFTLVEVKNNSVYYQITDSGFTYLYRHTLNQNGKLAGNPTQLTFANYNKFYVLNDSNPTVGNNVIALNTDTNLILLNRALNNESANPKTIVNNSVTILGIHESLVAYLDSTDNKVKVIDVKHSDPQSTIKVLNTGDKTLKTDSETFVDFDGFNVYIYVSYTPKNADVTAKYYLNRISLSSADLNAQFIGNFEDAHLPEKPDNSDKPADEHELWIK